MIDKLLFNIREFKKETNFSYGDIGAGSGSFRPFPFNRFADGFIEQFKIIPWPNTHKTV